MSLFKHLHNPIIYFSKCRLTNVYNEDNTFLGKLQDFFIDYEESFPTVLAILIKKKKNFKHIPWENITSFSYQKIIISNDTVPNKGKTFFKITEKQAVKSLLKIYIKPQLTTYPGLAQAILDKQIVDTHGKKVVRVNDIQLIKSSRMLRVTHAAIGSRSMFRRLGIKKPLTFLLRLATLNKKKEFYERTISWKFVHAIGTHHLEEVKLNVSNDELLSIHPADLADIIEELDGHSREKIFKELKKEKAADTLAEIEQENVQINLLKTKMPRDAAKIIEHMGTDEAADILGEMEEETVQKIIQEIEDIEVKKDIQELLGYKDNCAGGLMSTDAFCVTPQKKKREILKHLENHHEKYENIYDIYIIDDNNTLIGTCSLRRLLSSKEDIAINDIMNSKDMKYQNHNTHWKQLAEFMSKYNLINVPVVNDDKKLLGFVSIDDILPWLLDEH